MNGTQRLKHSILRTLIRNQLECTHQISRNTCEINKRGTRNQHLLCTTVQAYLKRIGKFIHLYHRAADCNISQNCQIADHWFSQCNRAKGSQCRKCHLLGHADRTEKNIQPFVFCKGFSSLLQFININVWQPNRCQLTDTNWRNLFLLFCLEQSGFPSISSMPKLLSPSTS